MAESFARKNEGKHRRRKAEKSCVTFMCDTSWCVHTSDVQNKWDDRSDFSINTHIV